MNKPLSPAEVAATLGRYKPLRGFGCRNCGAYWGAAAQPHPQDETLCYFCIHRVPTEAKETQNRIALLENEVARLRKLAGEEP